MLEDLFDVSYARLVLLLVDLLFGYLCLHLAYHFLSELHCILSDLPKTIDSALLLGHPLLDLEQLRADLIASALR